MNREQKRKQAKQERTQKSFEMRVSKMVEHINLRNAKANGVEIRQARAHESALKERAKKKKAKSK